MGVDIPRRVKYLVSVALTIVIIVVLVLRYQPGLASPTITQPTAYSLESDANSRGPYDFLAPAVAFRERLSVQSLSGSRPSILIFQHIPYFNPLYRASFATHKLYAEAWGYQYDFKTEGGVSRDDRRKKAPSMNKMYVLKEMLSAQLNGPAEDRVDWIMMTDADTIISDPSLPLHVLLPPDSLSPKPLFLGSQDHNGFNAGVMIFRVESTILTYIEWVVDRFESTPDKGDGWAPSDQVLLAEKLVHDAELASHFYEIPKFWLNAYFLHDTNDDDDIPQLQVHLVNQLKSKYRFTPIVKHFMEVLQRAEHEAQGMEVDQVRVYNHGLDLLPSFAKAEHAGETYWKDVKGGIENVKFLWD